MEDAMNLVKRSASPLPAWRAGTVEDQFGRLVQDMFQELLGPGGGAGLVDADTARARLDVRETDTGYEVDAEMPGVKKEDVKVAIDHNRVTIEGEVQAANEQRQGENVVYSERSARKYLRSFTLPSEVDEAAAQARLENGILHLTLPKKQGPQTHRLTIQ
jgi:HSP20 family protein